MGDPEPEEIAEEAAEDPEGFLNLMGHLYRGEMSRTTTWRTRLDRTTNWAVVVTAAIISFAFSSRENPHFVILGGIVIVAFFLMVEARRYRMYDVWRSRVRLLEENVFAQAIEPRGVEHRRWRTILSEDLRDPKIKIPLLEAVGRRLRRVYLPIFALLGLAWVARITIFAGTGVPVLEEAAISGVAGLWVVIAVFVFYWAVFALALWPRKRKAKGELETTDEDWRGDD